MRYVYKCISDGSERTFTREELEGCIDEKNDAVLRGDYAVPIQIIPNGCAKRHEGILELWVLVSIQVERVVR